ncbi:hypothetical protein E6C27_scaffold1186G00060 [Cucumis melo var. makuwa]|uniref:Ty3-gypsy retrotransposon protein n=1 Tax=Cucumis melo var. makuwa TaxID=1194695 RepID=A0A5A7UVA1_CUCMM|nr:hypothetical protein E6C27_scaffold1186G00060 [Cucumis melo var. makuwa]
MCNASHSRRTLPRLFAVVEARPSSELRQSLALPFDASPSPSSSLGLAVNPSNLHFVPSQRHSRHCPFVYHRRASPPLAVRRVEAKLHCRQAADGEPSTVVELRDLTLKFLGPTASSFGDSSLYSDKPTFVVSNDLKGKGFPTTGPRVEAGNVIIHRGLYGNVVASGSLCAIVCNELFTDRHRCTNVLCTVVMLMGYVANWNCMSMDLKVLRLIRASFGITRLIGVSFGNTRLICAFFEITRLIAKGTARGRPTRGKKDA